jgi:prepilin-type N-terminal cleavage/methylation domain-containing protein
MKNRPGMTLIEVMIAVMVFSFAITVFASLFPLAMRMRSKSENVSQATMIAQKKIDQLRALPYTSLTYTSLQGANVIDASPNTSPYSFTSVDNLATKLPEPTSSLTVSNAGSGSHTADLKQISVTVSWGGIISNGNSVTMTTQIANKEARVR